ncbi:PAAR domain-containing protein [Cupriavidus laharis]|nr:PAAR domain-containing protein [Cupriavidus laharis]
MKWLIFLGDTPKNGGKITAGSPTMNFMGHSSASDY